MRSRGFDAAVYSDAFLADEIEELPGNVFISNAQIARFFAGENYTVTTSDGDFSVVFHPDFDSYYELFLNFQLFGLPHGRGWVDELPWVIDFLKFFSAVQNEIESFNDRRAQWRQR